MSIYDEKLTGILKENGYSITKPRKLIFNILTGQKPLTINALMTMVDNKIDRVSVYRIIELFEKIGIVQRINIGWKYKIELADNFVKHHHHLVCLNCRKVIDIDEQNLENLVNQLANQHNFKIENHQIEIQGYCKKCRK
jgi:Fur family ferric uptake transcriptional regulator